MDPMIGVGLMKLEDRIRSCAMEYLSIEDISLKQHSVAMCRRMVVVLITNMVKPTPIIEKISRAIYMTPGIVTYTRKNFTAIYEGEGKMMHFIYTNIKNKVEGKRYFELSEFFQMCIDRYPETDNLFFYNAKPLAMYFVKQNMSTQEINHILGFPSGVKPIDFELDNKDSYFSAIDSVIDEMMLVLKQQTK